MSPLTRIKLIAALQGVVVAEAIMGIFFVHDLGLDFAQMSVVQAASFAVMILCAVQAGQLSDRYGCRRVLLIGNIAYCIALVVYATASSLPMAIACQAIVALSTIILVPPTHTLLRQLTGEEYGRAQASAMSWSAVMIAVSQIVASLLAAVFGARLVLIASVIVPLACYWLARGIAEPANTYSGSTSEGLGRSVLKIWQTRGLRTIVVIYSLMYAGAMAPLWLFTPLLDRSGYPVWALGFILAIRPIGMLVISRAYGVLAGRLSSPTAVTVGYLVITVSGYTTMISGVAALVPIGIALLASAAVWSTLCMKPLVLAHPGVANAQGAVQGAVTALSLVAALAMTLALGQIIS